MIWNTIDVFCGTERNGFIKSDTKKFDIVSELGNDYTIIFYYSLKINFLILVKQIWFNN